MPIEPLTHRARVGDADRARAERLLQEAYCQGRLDEQELDERLGTALAARTHQDLGRALAGLPPRLLAPRPAPRPPQATVLGGVAHFSGLFTWIVGPLLAYLVATPGSPGRRQAARAFNFQLTAGLLFVATAVVGGFLLEAWVAPLMFLGWLGWFVLTVVGGARAVSGQPFVNPVMRVLPLHALDPRGR